MKFMDRLARLLGRLPDSSRTEADRLQHQSEHTATSDIEILAADDGLSGHKGASRPDDRNFVHPQSPDLVAPHDAPHSERTISSGEASSIDLGHTVSAGSCRECCGNSLATLSGHVKRRFFRRRGQGASVRWAERGSPIRRPCASGSGRRQAAPRAPSARSRRRAARSGS